MLNVTTLPQCGRPSAVCETITRLRLPLPVVVVPPPPPPPPCVPPLPARATGASARTNAVTTAANAKRRGDQLRVFMYSNLLRGGRCRSVHVVFSDGTRSS